jgi:TetR/AcrR family transcriptional regulator, fatty acid metabolism regulator protein
VTAAADSQREKRRLILRAAIKVFAEKGYYSCRVSDVANEAGVAYGLVYHYFSSKEELLETIFRRTWSNMLDAVREVEEGGESAEKQLAQVARIVLRAWLIDPDLVRVLVREVARSPHLQDEVDEIANAFAALERIIASGQERGELRSDVDPRLAGWIVYGALEEILTGWVFERLAASEEDVERAEAAVADILTRGLLVER